MVTPTDDLRGRRLRPEEQTVLFQAELRDCGSKLPPMGKGVAIVEWPASAQPRVTFIPTDALPSNAIADLLQQSSRPDPLGAILNPLYGATISGLDYAGKRWSIPCPVIGLNWSNGSGHVYGSGEVFQMSWENSLQSPPASSPDPYLHLTIATGKVKAEGLEDRLHLAGQLEVNFEQIGDRAVIEATGQNIPEHFERTIVAALRVVSGSRVGFESVYRLGTKGSCGIFRRLEPPANGATLWPRPVGSPNLAPNPHPCRLIADRESLDLFKHCLAAAAQKPPKDVAIFSHALGLAMLVLRGQGMEYALPLCVAVEECLKATVAAGADIGAQFKQSDLDEARNSIDAANLDQRLSDRLRTYIGRLGAADYGNTVDEQLDLLTRTGSVDTDYADAWRTLRNRCAHADWPISRNWGKEWLPLCHKVLMLLYQIIFHWTQYAGPCITWTDSDGFSANGHYPPRASRTTLQAP